jgi:predicted permease
VRIPRWLDPWHSRRQQEEDLARELDTHLAIASDEQRENGLSPVDARYAAQKQLGSVTLLKEEMREMSGWAWLERLVQDARYALRMMRKNPGFAAITICTLAIGIGANTAVFSVVDHIVFRPFGYQDPEQLVAIHEVVRFTGATRVVPVNLAHFQEWRRLWSAAEDLAVIGGMRMSLTGAGEPERLQTMRVSANLFSLLGVQPQLGRTFALEEDQRGRDHVVLLSDDLWRRRFNADPRVVGRAIALNDERYEIVGVLPPLSFPKVSELFPITIATTSSPQLWKPLGAAPQELASRGDYNFACIARLKPGISVAQARSALNALQETLPQRPPDATLQANVVPLVDQVAGRVQSGLALMWAAVGAVLLIGCVNMANLLLARTLSRRREMAIRAAIGASRGRLMRQVLVESLLMSVIGGITGVAAAYWVLQAIVSAAPVDLPRVNEIHIDPRVLTFALCVSLISGVLVGVLPAWRLGVLSAIDALKSGSVSVTSARSTGRLRAVLVACEVGVSAVCLIAGGLLVHSFWKLLQVDSGFAASRVLTIDVSLPVQRYSTPVARTTFIRTALEHMHALPGVVAAGVSNKLPLTGEGGNAALWLDRGTAVSDSILGDIRPVNADYFRTMTIPLRQGRLFSDADRDRSLAVISAVAAARLWPGEDPIGKQFHIGAPARPPIQVVGVVGDVRGVSLDRPPSPTVYVPYQQSVIPPSANSMDLVLVTRTAADPMTVSSSLRGLIRSLDPELALPAVRTMDDVVTESFGQRRFQMALVLLFAAAATLLASLGIYGVVSYAVGQRTNEIGIRLALGALPADIRRLVVSQGFVPVLIGLGAGVLASGGMGRLLGTLLFGVTPTDPLTLTVVVVVFVTVALAAMYVPTQRATRVDPLQTLRQD